MIELAIIGPTASGKSDLSLQLATKMNAYIFSIDSLSIYKEIDIVSAKPSQQELNSIRHFGINNLYPDESFSVDILIKLYKSVKQKCIKDSKNLIIVGGTSFYLRSLLKGLSPLPDMDKSTIQEVKFKLNDIKKVYSFLYQLDEDYMKNIDKNDRYRIEKALLIYQASNYTPSQWFKKNPPKPIIKNLKIFNIIVKRGLLRERIDKRTKNMLNLGLIDEVCYLEQKYTRAPNSMGAIGIKEVLQYLDSKITKIQMLENISIHTAQLAKRQQTFNKTQFIDTIDAPIEELEQIIISKYI